MVAGLFPAAGVGVDAGGFEPPGRDRVEQQVVDADAGVAGEGVAPIIPEGEDRLVGMEMADGVGPALLQQPAILGARLGLEQGVVAPALGLVDVGVGRE